MVSSLRLSRLQKGLTLDDLFLRSKGKLNPARLSRIERGLCSASLEEAALLIKLLSVSEQIVLDASSSAVSTLGKSAESGAHRQSHSKV